MSVSKRKPILGRLTNALEECESHVRGKLNLRTVEIPDEPPDIDGPTLAALRKRAGMSQAYFARVLNVSTKTLQSWEQGTRRPSDAARRLIQIFSEQPEMMCRTVGVSPVRLPGVVVQKNAQGRRRLLVTANRDIR